MGEAAQPTVTIDAAKLPFGRTPSSAALKTFSACGDRTLRGVSGAVREKDPTGGRRSAITAGRDLCRQIAVMLSFSGGHADDNIELIRYNNC